MTGFKIHNPIKTSGVKSRAFFIFFILSFWIISTGCSSQKDYSGIYVLKSGKCTHEYLQLKKVKGFGDKYYLVLIYHANESPEDAKEYLGVISGTKIMIKEYVIDLYDDSCRIKARDKDCLYIKN